MGCLAGDLWLPVWFLTGAKWCGPLCLNEEVLPAATSDTIRLHYVVSDRPDMVARAQSFSLCRLPSLPPSRHNGWSICAQCSAGLSLPFKGAKYRAEAAWARPALINHTPAANATFEETSPTTLWSPADVRHIHEDKRAQQMCLDRASCSVQPVRGSTLYTITG